MACFFFLDTGEYEMKNISLLLCLFLFTLKVFAVPNIPRELSNIARGPEVDGCPNKDDKDQSQEEERNEELVDDELYEEVEMDGSDSIISKLLNIGPVKLDDKGLRYKPTIFLTVEIPAYNGKPAEKIRTDSSPFDINSFFKETERKIYDYDSMKDLEEDVLSHVTTSVGKIDPGTRKKVQESITILDYTNMIRKGQFKRASSYLTRSFKGKSVEEKMSFLGSLLKKLNENYNIASMGQGIGGKDIPRRDLAKAILINNDGVGDINELKAGVCRHIHQFAVQAARRMGLKLSFGVSYPVATGYHSTMVVSDPDNPGRTYKLNYEGMKRDDLTRGHSVLETDEGSLSSNGITYHMWGEKDQPVYFVPSERGLVLAQVAGEELENFDPNIRSTAKKIITGVRLGKSVIKLFYAKTSAGEGETITGAAYTREVNYNDYITGNYGIVAYRTTKNNRPGSTSPYGVRRFETTTAGLYFYIDHKLQVNVLKMKNFKLKLFTSFSLRGTGFSSDLSYVNKRKNLSLETGFLADGSGQLLSGFEAKIGSNFSLKGISDVSGQISDITAQAGGLQLYGRRYTLESRFGGPLTSSLEVSNTNRFNLIPLEGNNIMVGSSDLSFGSPKGDKQVTIGIIYPISEIVPSYIPGSRMTIEAAISAALADGMLGVTLNGYIVPGQKFKKPQKLGLQETRMTEIDFTIQEGLDEPQPAVETEFGVGITGELKF